MNIPKRSFSLVLALLIALSLSPAQAIAVWFAEAAEIGGASLHATIPRTYAMPLGLGGVPSDAAIQSPSGLAYDTRVSFEIATSGMTGELDTDTRAAVVRFTLKNPGELPVSFRYTTVSGSANTAQHLSATLSGSVSLSKENPQADITIGIAPFKDNPSLFGMASNPDAFWTGTRLFYLFCSDIQNALFDADGDSLTIPVPVESAFDYAAAYDNAAQATLIDLDAVGGGSNGVYPIPVSGTLTLTAEISGDIRKMLDAGVLTHLRMPEGYFRNGTGAAGTVDYRVERSIDVAGETHTETRLTYGSLPVGTGENTPFFSDFFPQMVNVGAVGLGPAAESNKMTNALSFIFNYDGLTGPINTCFLDGNGTYLRYQVQLYDEAAPVVKSVSVGASEIRCGDEIPVVISFSEPVYTGGITFEIDGQTVRPMEGADTISESVSFLYTVGDAFLSATEVSVNVENIIGAVDLSGKPQESAGSGSASAALSSFDPERSFVYCAEPSVTLDQGTSRRAVATVSIPLKRDGDLSNWLLDSSRLGADNISSAVQAKVITADGVIDLQLTVQVDALSVTGLTGSFTVPENTTDADVYDALELYMDTGSGYKLVYGLTTFYAVPPIILINDTSDLTLDYSNWPSGNSLFADVGASLSLDYTLNVAATWQGSAYLTWASSDETIAAIDASGSISLTGVPGAVGFTLTVTNPLSADTMTFDSHTLTVLAAEGPYLYVPSGLKNQEILMGSTAKISFSSNLCQRNDIYGGSGTATAVTFTLYAADYEGDVLKKGNLLSAETLSATAAVPMTSYTVPLELLQISTAKGRYGYILEISAEDMQARQLYTAEANIRVRALPAKAVLARPETAFLTDSSVTFGLRFDIENKNAETEYLLTVTKNSQSEPVRTADTPADIGRLLTFDIGSVGNSRLLDVYTVSLKAKNGSDEAWSYDSYCVYVYNADAMKILVNGLPYNGTTLLLEADFEDGDIIYNTDVLRYPSGLGLTRTVSINGSAYAWSSIADKITWSAEGGSVSLYYSAGGAARRIGDDDNPMLLPGTALTLRGDGAGSSVVTATHTLTGMAAAMNVTVAPLNEKLYLFQAYPQVPCDIVYTNGKGMEKTVNAASGKVGVYEESGIAGDVAFYPTGGAEAVYDFAVLSHSALMANQKSTSSFDLYPMNTAKLPHINYNVSLQLYDEETGIPYTGDIVLRGGVYFNGVYQSATTINGNLGNADQTVSTDGEGRYRLAFRPSDFAEKLRAADKLHYVIEVCFADSAYLTKYITVDNDAVQAGRASPLGVCLSAGIQKLDASSIQNSAVVLSQTLTINGAEKSLSDLLTLEAVPESATLDMTLMIPGNDGRYYQVFLMDAANGRAGYGGSAAVTTSYPFSDTVTLHSSVDLRTWLGTVLHYTLKPGEKTNLYPMIRSTDGSTEIKLSKPVRIWNLYGIPKMSKLLSGDSDYNKIYNLLSSIASTGVSYAEDNDAVKNALDIVSTYGLYAVSMGLEVQPTDNPLVYKGIIRYAAGSYSKDNPSGVFVGSGETSSHNFMPGTSDLKAMAKGTFLKESKEEMKTSRGYKTYGGGAYLECDVYFSTEEQAWKVRLLTGDVYLGGGGVYYRHFNGWVSFVPVTATFQTSLTAELGLTILRDGGKTAYIPRLRPVFSVYGFGGVGRDYEVVSLKAGVYGFAQHEQLYLWYSDSDGLKADGQRLKISGEVGVEYKIKLTFIELNGKYVLTSASKAWTYDSFNDIYAKMNKAGIFSAPKRTFGDTLTLVPVEESASFEDRSYLRDFDRAWSASAPSLRLFSTAASDTVTDVWTNAYPYAAPAISDDGKLMAYLSDMDSADITDTAACFTKPDASGTFPEGTEISGSDYPDSSLTLSGTATGAAAVWVRSFTDIGGDAGDTATVEDAIDALAASEVMAGVYKGTAFTTTRLTDNGNPDLAPVTAASGDRAVAAWRSVTLGALDNPFAFTSDYLHYSVYNGSAWSEVKCLYDGSIDGVSALSVAMLPDGTAAIVYQITEADGRDSEIVCAVLSPAGEVLRTLQLTDNATADENPQITTAIFPDGTRRFVVGWNAQTESSEGTVRLAALGANGMLYPEFALELSDSSCTGNGANFRFTKGAERLEDLSVVWCEPEDADNDGSYAGIVFGTKLVKAADGTVSSSGKQKLLALDEGQTADSVDVRVDPLTGKLYFSLLLTEPDGSATLATADYEYRNALTLAGVDFSYEDVLPGLALPVRFTVTNAGVEPLTGITVAMGGKTYTYADEAVAPGETKDFVVSYPVPEPITDIGYTVTAQFGSDGVPAVQTGLLKLVLPDVGIYQLDLTKETQRERSFRVLLRNNTPSDLKAGTHIVTLEVWDTPDFGAGAPLKTLTFSGENLEVLNNSLLSADVTLNAADLAGLLDEDGEIPEDGAELFFRVVLQEDGAVIEDADISNDMDYIKIHSLIEYNGAAVSLASLSQTAGGKTTVQVEAFNNSMNAISNGNLVVTLRDESGNALETKQTYNPADSGGLLSIAGEESGTASLQFDRAGYTADVAFALVSGESTRLSVLSLTGVPMDFDPDEYVYTIETYGLSAATLTAVAENPVSTISVMRNGVPVSVSGPITLSYGTNTFVITVRTGDIAVPYTLTIQNARTDGGTVPVDVDTGSGNDSAGLTINGVKHNELSMRVSGGRAVVSLGTLAQELFSGDTEAILTVPAVSGVDGYTLEIPAAILSGAQTGAALTVSTELGSLRIPSDMLSGRTDLAGKTAGVTIAKGDKTALPDDIRATVGDRPLLSLTLTLDGLQTDWSNPNAPVTVHIPYTPTVAELEDPESLVIWHLDNNGNSFCIPSGRYDPLTGTVTFTTTHFSDYAVVFNPVRFGDVASGVWYRGAVSYIAAREITTGTENGKFSPNATLTRGQFITLLLRAYGLSPDTSPTDNFSDAGNTYYTGYLAAAKRLEISNGIGSNQFLPEQSITRQEMFTMLYNALKVIKQLPTGNSSKTLPDFTDSGTVADWAHEAVSTMVKSGLVSGNGEKLSPADTATRAEMAQLLYTLMSR